MTSTLRWILAAGCALAAAAAAEEPAAETPRTFFGRPLASPSLFPHPDDTPTWVSGQVNVILQAHPAFASPYQGQNSLSGSAQGRTSVVATLFTGIAVSPTTELFVDLETAGGRGLSDALGLAGFTNLDVVRNPSLGAEPYLARVEVRQIIPLSEDTVPASRGPLALATRLPATRLELRAGKLSTADLFDVNAAGSDSHLQFMNWTVANNGAYDYAADTRGYTWGLVVELQTRRWGVRFGEMLMPKVANGIDLSLDLGNTRAENLEVEWRWSLGGQTGTVRALAYLNHAAMGSYREAIDAFRNGTEAVPDVTRHRHPGTLKIGFGLNAEQPLGPARLFFRAGWNEGAHESFAYTEVNDTFELGADVSGAAWRRPADRLGLALVTNGLSPQHRRYLALGGLGFLLGDGRLTYARETLGETYYTALVAYGLSLAVDVQCVANPGYNRDRGPVWVGSLRAHLDL